MRKKLALAVSAVAVAAAFAPLTSASALCDELLYATTGYCSPCRPVNDVLRQAGLDGLTCVA